VTILHLIFAQVRLRPLSFLLHAMMLALGVGAAIALLLFNHQSNQRLTRDAQGIDLVIGAKGSGLQLVLSSVFHADVPTGNIKLAEAEKILADPRVKSGVAVGLGDSVGPFRIVGADANILSLYRANLAEGRAYQKPFEAVIGADVARQLDLAIGETFVGAHGLGAGGGAHDEHPYTIVGILAPAGSVVDRLALTPLESVWEVHAGHGPMAAAKTEHNHDDHAHHDHAHHDHAGHDHKGHDHASPRDTANLEATAVLVSLRSPLMAVSMKREINQQSAVMAARPADETARLFSLVGVGADVMNGFAITLIIAAALSVFVTLLSALNDRRGDIALLRVMGATRWTVLGVLIGQGLLIAAVGALIGVMLGHGLIAFLAQNSAQAAGFGLSGATFLPSELWVIGAALAAGVLAALIPAILAYRVDIAKTLAEAP
jgi:putative ABC transport system permease protein